jgi:urease accessory protein
MIESEEVKGGSAAALARFLQFGEQAFPIGGFAFSNGLESAIQTRVVHDAMTLLAFARTATGQAASGDGVALIHAHRAACADNLDAVAQIDTLVLARKLSSENRTMSTRMGRKAAELGAQVTGAPLIAAWLKRIVASETPGCYPASLAVAFAAQALDAREAFVVHHYGVGSAILSAALRLMRIGHVDTQGMLYTLNRDVEALYVRAAATDLASMSGFAPMTEVLAAVHVKAHVRLFMN